MKQTPTYPHLTLGSAPHRNLQRFLALWQPGREPPQALLRAFSRISTLLTRNAVGLRDRKEQDSFSMFNAHLRGVLKLGYNSRLSPIP